MLKKLLWIFINQLNKVMPKFNRVIIIPFPNTESSALELANVLHSEKGVPVLYVTSSKQKTFPDRLLLPGVKIISSDMNFYATTLYILNVLTSRYVFFTHGIFLKTNSRNQVLVNLWHGLLYKKLGMLVGSDGVPADITIGASELSQDMYSSAFGVPSSSVVITGYPRNDVLIRSTRNRIEIMTKRLTEYLKYRQLIIWLPTYRQNSKKSIAVDGLEVGNPFYIADFDIIEFNEVLKKNNSYCIIKPHPLAVVYQDIQNLSNLEFIDDSWLMRKELSLYQLVGCTDMLISDVSSIVIDYLLIDKPIACISTDFDEYKASRGFYFSDIEDWLPNLFKTKEELITYVDSILSGIEDPFIHKRVELQREFFHHVDDKSTERIIDYTFNYGKQLD